ncbi:MAG: polysaccharide pyruvyl transferase family protein [Candidatus Freyarchaeota archaeon]|nr:polysaccharide pyruvyl transferase family protein [Candidatus Jordarchaeia archaeon]
MRAHIINNFYSLNRGWALLVLSVTNFLSNKIPGIEFTIESLYPDIDRKVYRNCKCVKPVKSSFGTLFNALTRAFVWRVLKAVGFKADALLMWEPLKYFYEANVVIDLSGDGLCPAQSKTMWYRIRLTVSTFTNLMSIILALLLEKPVVLYSHSIGNLGILRPLVKMVLKNGNVKLIALRDRDSENYLREMGITGSKIRLIADAAFSITPPEINTQNDAPTACFCISNEAVTHFYGYSTESFIQILRDISDYLVNTYSARILLVPFSRGGRYKHEDDLAILSAVLDAIRSTIGDEKVSLVEGSNLHEAMSAIAKCKFLVTSRMHPAIVALLYGVPPVLIAHSPKFHGLISFLKTEELLCDAKHLNYDSLKAKIEYVWENNQALRTKIREHTKTLQMLSLSGLQRLALLLSQIHARNVSSKSQYKRPKNEFEL